MQRSASSNCARGGGAAPASAASSTWVRLEVRARLGVGVGVAIGLGSGRIGRFEHLRCLAPRASEHAGAQSQARRLGVVQLGGCHLVVQQRRPLALRPTARRIVQESTERAGASLEALETLEPL